MPTVRNAQLYAETVSEKTPPTVRNAQLYVETVGPPPPPTVRNAQLYVETVGAPPRVIPGPEPLGCGEWVAAIGMRGGGAILTELPWSTLRHSRVLDDISQAEVEIPVGGHLDDRCCDVLRDLRAWEHELVLFRDGELAWVGPVMDPLNFTPDMIRIGARDLFSWFERRVLPFDRLFSNEELIVIYTLYFQDAMTADNPGITLATHHTGIFAFREVRATEFRRAADELRELGRTGLDWTMDRRTLRAGGREIPLFTKVTLTNETLLDAELQIRGADTTTESIVYGSPIGADPNDPFVGRAGGIDPNLGLLQVVSSEDAIRDQATADHAAQTRLDMLQEPPTYLSGTLSPELQVAYNQLIPGLRIDVRCEIGCRELIGQLRLLEVATEAFASDEGLQEQVGVTLVPLGST